MFIQIRRYVGGFLIALSLAGLLQAAMFGWVGRDGSHGKATSSGTIAFRRFGQHFWPALLLGVPVFLVGLACAGPPRQWFSPRPAGHRGRPGPA